MIDTQAIRNKLLDLAMRGKLTEQHPGDGSAEDLHRQILLKKHSLIKAGKIKKERPLSPITSAEIPYAIPASWKWIRWGDIVNIVSARRVHQADWRKTGIPFYRAREIAKLAVNGYVNNELFISEELYNEFSKSGVPHENDLMVSAVGTLGRTYIVQKGDRFYYKDASVLCFENFGNINPSFLALAMKSDVMRVQIGSNSGGTTVDTLTMVRMVKYLLPLPPLAEQNRIVERIEQAFSVLDTIDTLQTQYADNLTVLKSKLIDTAIQGKLTEQLPEDGTAEDLYRQIQAEKQALIQEGKIKKERPVLDITADEIPFEIPKSWKWVRLGAILSVQPSNGFSPQAVEYQTPYKNLTLTATTSGFFKPDAFKYVSITPSVADKYYLENDDILIQRSNSRDLVGTSCIYRGGNKKYIYPDLMMRMHVMKGINTNFIDYVLKAPSSRAFFKKEASGTSESMPKINQATVRNTLIPLPPLAEQKRIVAKLSELLPLCETR